MIRFIRKLNWAVRNHPALLSKIKTRRLRAKEVSPRAFLTFAEVENAFVFMERYSEIKDKLKREIVLLRGRGCVYKKGISVKDPAVIAENFDEANFLFGLEGQSLSSMKRDIELGLEYFERICVNLMCGNSTPVKPDSGVIDEFMRNLYPLYKDDTRVDILVNNTDFGVGA